MTETDAILGRKKVVVIGGGFAGRRAVRILQKNFDVTLIDAKGYFEFVPSALRCIVEPNHAKTIVLPHRVDTIIGRVTAIKPAEGVVQLSTGETVEFDYCMICSGSSYASPIKPNVVLESNVNERCEEFEVAYQQLDAAKRVIVVGGGTVGVELASEIVGKFGDKKKVTLVASQERLLERMPAKASNHAAQWFQKHGVELVLGDRVQDWGAANANNKTRVITTDQGRIIEADLVYKCIGFAPCVDMLPDSSVEQGTGLKRKPIHVKKTMQVDGFTNVFAAGDCTDSEEEKTALSADISATIASKNILRLENGEALLSYPEDICGGPVPSIIDVSLYKYDGILQVKGLVLTGFMAGMSKYMVEFIQIMLAKEWTPAIVMWDFVESSVLWLLSKF